MMVCASWCRSAPPNSGDDVTYLDALAESDRYGSRSAVLQHVLVDLEPVRGSKASKRRPAIIVSNDGANDRAVALGRGVVAVVPVTSNVASVLPFHVLISAAASGLRRDSKAQAEQIRSVDVERTSGSIGRIDVSTVLEVDDALRLHLSL